MATAPAVAAVEEGQLWRSQGQKSRLVMIEELPEGEYLLGEIAMIQPVEIVRVRDVNSGTISAVPRRWFNNTGQHYLRIPEADEHYESAEEARAAGIDGWRISCERCGAFGARRIRSAHHRLRLTLCHNHIVEWKLLLEQQDRERRAFYA